MVVELPEPPGPLEVVATLPTADTTPGVVVPSGSVTVTISPALTSDWSETSSGTVTTCRSEVTASTGPDAGPPRLPVTRLTRIAPGSYTTCPSGSDPDGEETPSADCSFPTPACVSQEK